MKVILFGSSGMVGQGALRECLRDPEVTEVVTVVRSASTPQATDPKLREIVHQDFTDFSGLAFDGDACFWCLGVTSAGMSEADYMRITHDYTLAAAKVLARPTLTFVFVSGTGADGTAMWARVKRQTEQDLAALPFKALYVFRPGMIQPLHGIRSRTAWYRALYAVTWPLFSVIGRLYPTAVTTTERVGRAMIAVAIGGYEKRILGNVDINAVAERAAG